MSYHFCSSLTILFSNFLQSEACWASGCGELTILPEIKKKKKKKKKFIADKFDSFAVCLLINSCRQPNLFIFNSCRNHLLCVCLFTFWLINRDRLQLQFLTFSRDFWEIGSDFEVSLLHLGRFWKKEKSQIAFYKKKQNKKKDHWNRL